MLKGTIIEWLVKLLPEKAKNVSAKQEILKLKWWTYFGLTRASTSRPEEKKYHNLFIWIHTQQDRWNEIKDNTF